MSTPGPFPLHMEHAEMGRIVIVTNQGNHFASTFDPTAARMILALPDLVFALEQMHSCHRAFSSSEDWTLLDDEARELAENALDKIESTP